MCKSNQYPHEWTYGNNVVNKLDAFKFDLRDVENVGGIFTEAMEIIALMLATDLSGVVLNPLLVNLVYNDYKSQNSLAEQDARTRELHNSSDNNIWNFAVAKTFHFIKNLKSIKKGSSDKVEERTNKLSKLVFSDQQKVEKKQVNRVTKNISKQRTSNVLEYVAEMNNTRDTHAKADGAKLPADHPFWKTANKLLGEWNCNCTINEVLNQDPELHNPGVIPTAKVQSASDVNVENGMANVFSEDLPTFGGTRAVRRWFRK